jgi:hypothetical protein
VAVGAAPRVVDEGSAAEAVMVSITTVVSVTEMMRVEVSTGSAVDVLAGAMVELRDWPAVVLVVAVVLDVVFSWLDAVLVAFTAEDVVGELAPVPDLEPESATVKSIHDS